MESLGMSPGALPSGGPGFPVSKSFSQVLGVYLMSGPRWSPASEWSLFCLFPPSDPGHHSPRPECQTSTPSGSLRWGGPGLATPGMSGQVAYTERKLGQPVSAQAPATPCGHQALNIIQAASFPQGLWGPSLDPLSPSEHSQASQSRPL